MFKVTNGIKVEADTSSVGIAKMTAEEALRLLFCELRFFIQHKLKYKNTT